MKIIRHPKKKTLKGCVVALGTFDGVHLGHQKVLQKAISQAKKIRVASIAISFDPHPQQIVCPERGLKLLTTLKEREQLFCGLGLDGVVVFNFTHHLQKLSSEEFIKRYLVDRLGVRQVLVGYDYAFGGGRAGDTGELKKLGKKFEFRVTVVPPVQLAGQPVKSRLIRELIASGKFNQAVKLLGHPYQITGTVGRGRGVGRGLGFPTANLQVAQDKLIPAHGVYAGMVNDRKCAVNIGDKPTFGFNQPEVEVHILNFKGNLRGKLLTIDLFKRLREEKQFADVEKLKAQIRKDIGLVRAARPVV